MSHHTHKTKEELLKELEVAEAKWDSAKHLIDECGKVREDLNKLRPVFQALLAVLNEEQEQPFDRIKAKERISHLVGIGQHLKPLLEKLA